jgi:hypothetical protein
MPQRYSHITVTDAATYSLKKYNTGLRHYVPDLSQDITLSLPTVEEGLVYELVYAGSAADAADWLIDTGSDTNYFIGGVLNCDTDAGTGAAEITTPSSDNNSNSKMTVTTPDVGTILTFECDGTHWYVSGTVASATAAAFADQA